MVLDYSTLGSTKVCLKTTGQSKTAVLEFNSSNVFGRRFGILSNIDPIKKLFLNFTKSSPRDHHLVGMQNFPKN